MGYRPGIIDISADLLVLFIGYQLANNYYKDNINLYFHWFILVFVADLIWVLERFVFQSHIVKQLKQTNVYIYWMATDAVAIILLLFSPILITKFGFTVDRSYCLIMISVSILIFGLDPVVENKLIKIVSRKKKKKNYSKENADSNQENPEETKQSEK